MEATAARCGLILALLVAPVVKAQDAHYWTRQFGNRAWLLGGSFIGNPGDISAVYYNPGALALLGAPELELSGSVYEFTRLSAQDDQGRGNDVAMSRVGSLPSFVAGSMRFGFLGKSKLAYSLVTRQGFSYSLEARNMVSGTNLGGFSGLDQLAADARLDESVGEYWAGITWAYPLGEHLGIGITPFGALRDQEIRSEVLALGSGNDGRAVSSTLGQDFHLQHIRLLAKLGLNYLNGPWALGLAVTTPSVAVWGKGQSGYQRAVVQQGFELASLPTSVFNFQDSLSARFRSSWALALGVSRTLGHTTLHLGAEGFARQSSFTLIDTVPFSPQGSSEVIDPNVSFALAPVVNVAVGMEHRLSKNVHVYLSAHTDFSALTDTPGKNALLAGWDIYHATWGLHFVVGQSRFTVGNNLAWGSQVTQRLSEALAETGLPSLSTSQKVHFFQATFVVGASFALFDQRTSAGEPGEPDEPQPQ